MVKNYTWGKDSWVDLHNPTAEEIKQIIDTYNIHPFVAKEMTSATQKPRVEYHDGYVFCILHFPVLRHSHSTDTHQEIDFIVGKNLLITTRYDTVDALHKFGKEMEVKEILDKDHEQKISSIVFPTMLRELYAGIFDEIESLEDKIEEITSEIFKGHEKNMVVTISETTRTLLDFKKVTELHHEVLESLLHHGVEVFDKVFARQMETVILDYLKINTTIRNSLDLLRELRETNNSLLYSKQNEVIKQLTIMGFTILPINFIAIIFAMRVEGLPFISNPNGFLMVLVLMVSSLIITLSYAKKKKWI